MPDRTINIGLLGLGVVGSGALRILQRNRDEIARRTGCNVLVRIAAVRDVAKPRDADLNGIELTDQPEAAAAHPEVDIVIELLGGIEQPLACIQRALAAGKHVITANKALLAEHGNQLFEEARQRGLMIAFEAAVAGGIPIIKALREGCAANRIHSVRGIVNGTCNYILSRLSHSDDDFAAALKAAQEQGFAEADPTLDLDGTDAAHKLALLAAIAFGTPLEFAKIHREGITGLTPEDLRFAAELGYRIKHLAIAKRREQGIELRVHPTLVANTQLLAAVEDQHNAVLVQADALGDSLYYGPGAGGEPTASAVLADLADVVRAQASAPENRVPYLGFQPNRLAALPVLPMEETRAAYYLKLAVKDEVGVLAEITRLFAEHELSIDSMLQKGGQPESQAEQMTVVIVTHQTLERNVMQARQALGELGQVCGAVSVLRIEPV